MKLKKALVMILAGAMTLSLAACGEKRSSENTDDSKAKSDSGELCFYLGFLSGAGNQRDPCRFYRKDRN